MIVACASKVMGRVAIKPTAANCRSMTSGGRASDPTTITQKFVAVGRAAVVGCKSAATRDTNEVLGWSGT
jgi:hypothetical protein